MVELIAASRLNTRRAFRGYAVAYCNRGYFFSA
jgi:hypothetical protein